MSLSAAVRVGGFGKRWLPGQFGVGAAAVVGSGPVGGPQDPIGLKVEIFVNGAWTDISSFVYYKNRVKITRGKPNESSQIQPQTCTFTINNRDGRFSPRNPLGLYYGQIGRNTPVRVSRMQNGIRRFRFYGEIPSWPTQYDISGTDVFGTVTAAGQMRRLFQGNQPLRSTLFRAYTLGYGSSALQNLTAPLRPIAYWPCEDSSNATSIASGLPGGSAMTLSGQAPPTFASNSAFACSAPLPLLAASIWTGTVPPYTGGTANVLRFLLSIPATGAYDTAVIARLYTAGTVARLDLTYSVINGGTVQISGYDASGNTLFANGYFPLNLNSTPTLVSMELLTSGSNVNYRLAMQDPGGAVGIIFDSGFVVGTVGVATQVVINADGHLNDTAVGHISVQSALDDIVNIYNALNAWLNESPILRFARLCGEQGVPAVESFVTTAPGDATVMGYQTLSTFPAMIQQITDTLAAPVFETRDQLSLALRSKGTLYNQAAKLTLDHSRNQLSGPLAPVDDDALTRNDVTVTRIGGSSAQVVQTTGALSTAPPPAGVGDYPTNYSLSLGSDSLLADQAGWRLHLGTVDQPRFPNVPINLRHSTFTSNLGMMNAALTIDIGDRLVITDPPPWMPPDPISQIVLGYSETLGVFEHDMVFNCAPEDPYRVALLEDTVLGHADTDGSILVSAMTSALNANPLFAGGSLTGWTSFNQTSVPAGPTPATVPLPAGAVSQFGAFCTPAAAVSFCALEGAVSFPATAGMLNYVSAWVYVPGGYGTVAIGFDWRDASDVYIDTSVLHVSVAAGVWTPLSASFATFAGAARAIPRVGMDGSPATTNTMYVTTVVAWSGGATVATTNTSSPLWTTSAGDFPFDVNVGGERMTVTNISTAAPVSVVMGVDGTFESGIAGWIPGTGSVLAQANTARTGIHSGLVTGPGTSLMQINTPLIPVSSYLSYTFSLWMMLQAGTVDQVFLLIYWLDANRAVLSAVFSPVGTATGAWTSLTVTQVPPAGAVFAQLQYRGHTPGADGVYVDDVTFTSSNPQLFTVTRSTNGVVKAHDAAADVRLQQPMILSL